jgi:hypothetical protein
MRELAEKLAATAVGAIYVTIWFYLNRAGDRYPALHGPGPALIFVVLTFVVLLLLMAALVRSYEWGARLSIPFFSIGVAVGVVYDALSDTTMDRNLFPIEVVIWCAIFAAALGFGKELGAWLRKKRQSKTVMDPHRPNL